MYTKAEWIMLSEIFRGHEERCHQLLQQYPEQNILEMDWNQLEKEHKITEAERTRFLNRDPQSAEIFEKDCWRMEIQIVTPDSPEYPRRLYNYMDPPVVLYAAGDLSLLQEENTLTIVGTRNASDYGRKTAYLMSREAASRGIVIISGCAVGIDAAAHMGALAGNGKTIAILGCGMDINYPAEHYRLRKEIVMKGGLQITEYPPGTRPFKEFFPHRNRLLSGLARAVLIAEAPYRSGSLITAEYAVEQGKELFCIPPYSIWDSRCSGVARYLRDGASPVFSPADILLHFFTVDSSLLNSEKLLQAALEYSDVCPGKKKFCGKSAKQKIPKKTEPCGSDRQPGQAVIRTEEKPQHDSSRWVLPPQIADQKIRDVFALLDEHPKVLDELVSKSSLPVHELLEILSELEVIGLVDNHPGGRYSVKFEAKL